MRAYKWLLHLYPSSFRRDYGPDMAGIFKRRLATAGIAARPGLWAAAIADVLWHASLVHLALLRQDLHYSLRTHRRAPGFATLAVVIVALGVGASTAAFSMADFVLFRPLPFPEPERLVEVMEKTPGYRSMELSVPNYRDWKASARSFTSMGLFTTRDATWISRGEPLRLHGANVTADLWPTLGVHPSIGRPFQAADDTAGGDRALMLSDRLWRDLFGADPTIVGRRLSFDDGARTVIGVMPRSFHFPDAEVDFWTPFQFTPDDLTDDERANNYVIAIGRLRPGVTIGRAQQDVEAIADRLAKQFPKQNADTGAAVFSLHDQISDRSRVLLLALLGASGCVLLVACANLANLLMARAIGRRRELAVRAALGAGRERLVRQLLTESLLIAVVGGAVGVAAAVVLVPLLSRLVPTSLPMAAPPSVDLRVVLFGLGLTLATGMVFGIAPVFRLGSASLREGPRAGGGPRDRLRSALVTLEVASSVVLLVSAGLLSHALLSVRHTNPGFDATGVLTMRAELTSPAYDRVAVREAFYDRVLQDVRRLPGVTSAGFISFLPMSSFRGGIWPVVVPGQTDARTVRGADNVAGLRYITPGYLRAMGIRMIAGRDVADTDSQDGHAIAVVSESFVKRYWPGGDPIGRHFTFAFADRDVVGVVADVRFRGLERPSEPQVYLSSKQVPDAGITYYAPKGLAVRTTTAEPADLAPSVRSIIRRADPALGITEVQTLSEMVDLETAGRAVQVRVLVMFTVIAFLLAGIGIYGLLSFMVSQRGTEIGLRLALGATRRDIAWLVASRGVILAAAGVVPGGAAAYAAGRALSAALAGVPPSDPVTFATAIGLVSAMAVLGSVAPAMRAVKIDPMRAMRAE